MRNLEMGLEDPIEQTPLTPDTEPEKVASPQEYSMDKSWKEQLTEEDVEKIKGWAVQVTKQWHDEIHPDHIFLTETSAIPYGYVLKETWRTAYGKETSPKFHQVDPNFLGETMERKKVSRPKTDLYLNELIKNPDAKIIVFDEGAITGGPVDKHDYFIEQYNEEEGTGNFKEHPHTRSLLRTMQEIYLALKDKNPKIWGSSQAIPEILKGAEGKVYGRKKMEGNPDNTYEWSVFKSRKPTSKPLQSRDRYDRFSEDMLFQNLSSYAYSKRPKIRGYTVKHPEQRKRAIEYVNDLQELGREAGEELRAELEKKSETEK